LLLVKSNPKLLKYRNVLLD